MLLTRITKGLLILAITTSVQAQVVDLHLHPFMKEGLTWAFQGDFDEAIGAKSWKDRLGSKVNRETLEKSELRIALISFYAHPLAVGSKRASIRKQLKLAKAWAAQSPQWEIAYDPDQAQKILSQGKSVAILSLEGADYVLERERDLQEFIDQGGIRVVTPIHLIDNHIGGAAIQRGWIKALNPISVIRGFFKQIVERAPGKLISSPKGLTRHGKWLIRALAKRNVWVDLAHASDRSGQDANRILQEFAQPGLVTHTVLRHYYQGEMGITGHHIRHLRQTSGLVGLMPSAEYLVDTPASQFAGQRCYDSLAAFMVQYEELRGALGDRAVHIGTDFSGAVGHLEPSQKCRTGTSLDQKGLVHIGQMPDLARAREGRAGRSLPSEEFQIQSFLSVWKAVFSR